MVYRKWIKSILKTAFLVLADFVCNRRKKSDLTQIELADVTGVGVRFIRELEQGKPNLMVEKSIKHYYFFDIH
ncbi:helix-turn-helix domain-containing protein [Flagellimonas sp.]|uniref:helix-turn-helix domain-containing protein n=1 Tax=Flagellimonas sp. TaxID=2058762 RepID=UPI003BA8C515